MTLSPQTTGASGSMVYLTSTTLAAPAASIDIQNIPTSYSYIKIVIVAKCSEAAATSFTWAANNDAVANNYANISGTTLTDNSAAFGTATATGDSFPFIFIADLFSGTFYAKFDGYRSTTQATGIGHYWKSTDAVNRLTFAMTAGTFSAGTKVIIYGIR